MQKSESKNHSGKISIFKKKKAILLKKCEAF